MSLTLATAAAELLARPGHHPGAQNRAADTCFLPGNTRSPELIDLRGSGQARSATADARKYQMPFGVR